MSLFPAYVFQIGKAGLARQTSRKLMLNAEKTAAIAAEKKIASNSVKEVVSREGIAQAATKSSRNHFVPDVNATGAHSVFRRDPLTGKVTHYETYQPQTNRFDPKTWQSLKRYDGVGKGHRNKILKQEIETPHIHDPSYQGGIRNPEPWELP